MHSIITRASAGSREGLFSLVSVSVLDGFHWDKFQFLMQTGRDLMSFVMVS